MGGSTEVYTAPLFPVANISPSNQINTSRIITEVIVFEKTLVHYNSDRLPFNATFGFAVRRSCELGAGSIWFYGSRSFYGTSTGMLNGMAVCLMNRFKTQVSPRGCAISSFLSSIYTEEIMCNNNCLVPTGWPGKAAPFPVPEQRKIHCRGVHFIFTPRTVSLVGLVFAWVGHYLHQYFCSGSSSECVMSITTLINCSALARRPRLAGSKWGARKDGQWRAWNHWTVNNSVITGWLAH